jgi:aspartyl/asparaginyl beta-hydroxylase (cupin superfamily)
VHNLIRIAHGLPVLPLLKAVQSRPALWGEITARQDHPLSPHRDTEAIYLRWCQKLDIPSVFTDLHAVDYPAFHALHRETWPLLDVIYANVGGRELGRAMIVNLKPGGRIVPHVDEGAYADHFERFHLPLCSAPDNYFHVETDDGPTETVQMRAGELWWFDHKRTHWVSNQSSEPRIHLIVDIVAPKYRRDRPVRTPCAECA